MTLPLILDRYVLREFFRTLLLAIMASTVVFVLIHLMDHIDGYLDQEATLGEVLRYYVYLLPYNSIITLPMAMLIATILTMGELGRHEELTAMKAAGRSIYRVVMPVLLVAAGISAGVLVLGETVVPQLSRTANEIHEVEIAERRNDFRNYRADFPYRNEAGYTFLVRSLFSDSTTGSSADQVLVHKELPGGGVLRISAPKMFWEPERRRWILTDGWYRYFTPEGEERSWRFGFLRSRDFTETPQDFLQPPLEPEAMGYAELRRYIDRKERTGGDTTRERVDLHLKIAYPFANLVIVLFGVTLAGRSARRGGAALGFGLALFLCIVFWMSIKFGQGVGYGGGLPPWLAAWLANLVFGVLGLVLLLRTRS